MQLLLKQLGIDAEGTIGDLEKNYNFERQSTYFVEYHTSGSL